MSTRIYVVKDALTGPIKEVWATVKNDRAFVYVGAQLLRVYEPGEFATSVVDARKMAEWRRDCERRRLEREIRKLQLQVDRLDSLGY